MEKMDLIVAETRRQLETMEEGIEEPRSGGDGVREEMQTVSDSTVDVVQKSMENETRGELQKPTQRHTLKERVANLRDKKETLPWRRKCYFCKGEHKFSECPQRPRRKLECYFCEGEHKSSECPQRLILLARIQKRENEEEWEDSDSDSEEEEEEDIGPKQVSVEDRGSEPHLDITERKEDGPTTEGVIRKEAEMKRGPATAEFFPNEIQLILVEDQDTLQRESQLILVEDQDMMHNGRKSQLILVEDQDMMHDELTLKRNVEEGPTTEKLEPEENPSTLKFQNAIPDKLFNEVEDKAEMMLGIHASAMEAYRISPLELEELQKDSYRRISSRAMAAMKFSKEAEEDLADRVVQAKNDHSELENFIKKRGIEDSRSNKEREKTPLQLRNFHEEKT